MPNSHSPTEAAAASAYRDGFLRAVAHLGLDTDGAARLVEAVTGQPFDCCGQRELEPLLRELGAIAWKLRMAGAGSIWRTAASPERRKAW